VEDILLLFESEKDLFKDFERGVLLGFRKELIYRLFFCHLKI